MEVDKENGEEHRLCMFRQISNKGKELFKSLRLKHATNILICID